MSLRELCVDAADATQLALVAEGEQELRLRHRDGHPLWVRLSRTQRAETGKDRFIDGLVEDITGRKAAELALETKTHELERSNAELERFAYVASHDLQEPLRTVSSYLDLLRCRHAGELDPRARSYVDVAVEAAMRMRHLISDLLSYSRLGTGVRPQAPVPVDQVLDEALANLGSVVVETGAQVVRGHLPEVRIDRVELLQVLQNLIANALKFRSRDTPRVEIGARREGAGWEFSVADNGIGIDPAHHQRIFDIFQRLHHRSEYPGTGIGLASCKKIVEGYGGRIWVESTAGAGARFVFTLPTAAEEEAAAGG